MSKTYIGDGVYASFDGHMICLQTDRGNPEPDTIYLEPQVVESLLEYVEKSWNVKIEIKKAEGRGE